MRNHPTPVVLAAAASSITSLAARADGTVGTHGT